MDKEYYLNRFGLTLGTGFLITFFFPLDMIRSRMQASSELLKQNKISENYVSVRDCINKILQTEHWRAFWKGNGSNLIRFYLSETCNYGTKEIIKDQLKVMDRWKTHQQNLLHRLQMNFFSGALSALLSLFIIYPFEHARQRLANDISGHGSIGKYLVKAYKAEGIAGIYKGSFTFFITGAIFRAFYFGIFDTIKSIDEDDWRIRLFAGYVASCVGIFVVYPFDTMRRRILMTIGKNYHYRGQWELSKIILREEGFPGFFRGGSLVFIQSIGLSLLLSYYDILTKDIRRYYGSVHH